MRRVLISAAVVMPRMAASFRSYEIKNIDYNKFAAKETGVDVLCVMTGIMKVDISDTEVAYQLKLVYLIITNVVLLLYLYN